MPPKTRRLIHQVTSDYIYGVQGKEQQILLQQQPKVDFMDLVESEYDVLSPGVSMAVANYTFDGDSSVEEQMVICVASMVVLYQLPKEITLQLADHLLRSSSTGHNQALANFQSAFRKGGWDMVVFPKGLGMRVKRDGPSHFFPASKLPWRSRSTRKAAEAAEMGILAASNTKAPPQNIKTKEEFLVEIEQEMRIDNNLESRKRQLSERVASRAWSMLEDAMPSFPSHRFGGAWSKVKHAVMESSYAFSNNRAWKKLCTTMETQYKKLKGAGRAGLIAYCFMNFCLYTVGMTWQWRRMTLEPATAGASLVSLTLRNFVKVFMTVYMSAAVFKLARIGISLALAPAAGRVLQFTQRKLRVSENTAVAILIALLVKTFLGTLAIVCLGDSALRKALPVPTQATQALEALSI
ncbi:expressed unknown protein [Seminavis robusta]|uniref:Uncharacterized protein n=1 Tax=Seminavis robusta TaxID=568900 RepID=A0A9N8E9G3_9STRA|nr:expressed unknown protein [Seminavis robusta]|eukprot:Sro841_g209490.1 n/a (409) ;mRNA; r:5984-7210